MIAKKSSMLMVLAAALAVGVALPALARGPRGRGISRPMQARALHSHGLLGRLIFPCPADCVETTQDCLDTANTEALSCATDACGTEIAAAQAACGEDRSSDECEDAVDALADCADECLDTHADAVDVCRDTLRDCRDACESEE
jgi:hypothetical protein